MVLLADVDVAVSGVGYWDAHEVVVNCGSVFSGFDGGDAGFVFQSGECHGDKVALNHFFALGGDGYEGVGILGFGFEASDDDGAFVDGVERGCGVVSVFAKNRLANADYCAGGSIGGVEREAESVALVVAHVGEMDDFGCVFG